jgi:hypothetical protein
VARKGTFRFRTAGPTVVGLIAAALLVPSANAGLITGLTGIGLCTGTAVHPFTAWSDNAGYGLAPNGGFESGAASWTLSPGASVVAGNESFHANGAADSHALALAQGATATSGPVCLGGLTRATMRFFVASGSASPATVHVRVQLRGLLGSVLGLLDGGTVTAGQAWSPTPVLNALQLPIGTSSVQLQLSSTSGTVLLDDVYLDPWLTS